MRLMGREIRYFHYQVILPELKWACSDIYFRMEDGLLMLVSDMKMLVICDSCSEEVLIMCYIHDGITDHTLCGHQAVKMCY